MTPDSNRWLENSPSTKPGAIQIYTSNRPQPAPTSPPSVAPQGPTLGNGPVLDALRFILNGPASTAGLLAAVFSGGVCEGITSEGLIICGGATSWGWGGGTTLGNVFVTPSKAKDLTRAVLSHEDRHASQWAIFGPILFPVSYGLMSALSSLVTGGYACGNLFEMHAGLARGGYEC